MAGFPSVVLHTLWILFVLHPTNEVRATGHVQEFACFTDYAKELVCDWKVPAQTNCSEEFLLYYRKEFLPLQNVCVPENGKESFTCTCTIYPDYFVLGLTYILALQFNGTDMWNYSVTPALVVKPRAPRNLAIEEAENGNFNLSWEESYTPSSMLFGQPVIYEVKYWSKQHPGEISVKSINYQAKSFEITASSLQRGYDYIASVRCKYTDYPAYWSDWSDRVEFRCDYQVTSEDILQMAVPVSCILIMAVAVICYFCFTKVKKEWWDQIPNPAKSHLVVKNVKFSVLCYIDEIKFPFHDLKQSHMEKQTFCKNCLAQSLSSHNFKGKDNIRNVEKSCSCHSKSEEWFPKGSSAVLTPETILIEESVDICECLTDIEAESQDETHDQITMFEPCESSVSAFREHTEHNDALANMFIELLADENNMQDDKDPDIITSENKTFEKLESENESQRNPIESAAQSQQPCGVSYRVSPFTRASQDEYNCSTTSKKSAQSEESFESGYQSSSTNSASLDARDAPHMLHQSLFPCSSESQHDSSVLIQESPNKLAFETNKNRISNPGYKSFDTLVSPSGEPCSSAYKSFDALVSQSMANSSLTVHFNKVCSSLPLTHFSETLELCCRDQIYCPPGNQTCYTNYRSPCSELDFQNACSEHTDFPSFSTRANDRVSAFLPEEEIHKQVMYQNVQKKANMLSYPFGPQPSGYQPFDAAVKCNGTYFDNDSEVISKSLYEPFIQLLYNNLRETPPDTIIHEPDQRIDDHVSLIVQGFDCGIVPGVASSENVTHSSSDGSLWIINSNELPSDSEDENTSRGKQLLHLLELNYQDFNNRERTIKGTKPSGFNCPGKGTRESSSNRLNTGFQCPTHNDLRKSGNVGENKEVGSRGCGSTANLSEESLDSIGLNLKTAEPLGLLVSDKLSAPLCVDKPCPSDSHTIHSGGSRLAPAVEKRPAELLRENNRKNEKKIKLLHALAQEDNCYMKYTMCRENLTCFVDYVQTLSCILRNDLSASSYNLTATWVHEDNPENTVAACSLLQLSRNTSHTQYMCTVDMTELLADIKVQVDVTEIADRQHMISKGFYMGENIKPQPPFNLTAVSAEGYNISWETIYQNSFYFLNEELEYQLRYKRMTDTWETQKTKSVHEDKRTLVILPRELQGNTEYEFQVRARPREDTGYSGFWSEWSSPLTLKTSPAAVTQTAGMGWMLLLVAVVVITASITAFLAKQQSFWKKMACIPDPAPFFKPLYLVHNGDFKKWVGTSHTKMTLDFFEWGIVLPEVLEVYSMRPSNSTSQEEMSDLKRDLPCKPCVSCLTTPGQDSQSLLSSVNSSSGTQDRSYGHLSIETVTVADEFTPCNCQCNCNRMYRAHEHTGDEDSAGENGYPKVNIDDEDRRLSSEFNLSDLSTQDKILASGSVSTDHLRTTSAPAHQKVERALEGGMGSILEALCLHPNQWDLENPASLPSPDGESVSYSEGSYDFFPRGARPADSYPMICLDLDTIDSGFVDSDCGSPVDCEFEQNSQTNCGSVPLEQEGEDFPRSYVKQWVSCRSDSPVNGTQTN